MSHPPPHLSGASGGAGQGGDPNENRNDDRDQDQSASLEALAAAAQDGDARALERLLLAVHDRIYRLALRMTARPPDAEDATQEILVRIITRLATYRGQAAFMTWAHRVAVNYLMDRSKSGVERMELTFERFAADLLEGLSAGPSAAPDADLLEREVRLACTHALLTCLDREHRIAYVLGDILGVDSHDGGYICDVPPATYRKRLSRARQRVRQHLSANCGLVNDGAACRCPKRVDAALRTGRISRDRLEFTSAPRDQELRRTVGTAAKLARLHDAANLLRSLPPAAVPGSTRGRITALLATTGWTRPDRSSP